MTELIAAGYRASMWLGGLVCHQQSDRSPYLLGAQMPLCWRCSGILIGTLLFFAWLIARRSLPSAPLSLALAMLMPIDVLAALVRLWNGNNAVRLITGLLWGLFSTNLVLHLLRQESARAIFCGYLRKLAGRGRPSDVHTGLHH